MSLHDKPINLTSPKRKWKTRSGATKICVLSTSSNKPSSKHLNLEPSLEPPATTTLHDCSVSGNPELKHAEEKLASLDVETPNPKIPLPFTSRETHVIESLEPLSNIQTLVTLSTTVVFQQKHFRLDLCSCVCQTLILHL